MGSGTLNIQPLSPSVGAVITGVDLRDLTDEVFEQIRQAFWQYGVVFFKDQSLTPDDQVAFAERWGPININRFFKPTEQHPGVALVLKEPDQTENLGSIWHTDHSYDEIPALGSILYAVEVPPVGGDTLFAGMYAAYDALSDGMKDMLADLKAVHSSRHVFGKAREGAELSQDGRLGNAAAATQDAVHPVVITHPGSGRKVLYVNATFTTHFEGWSKEDSQPLLQTLYEHGSRDEFTCRFSWQAGSVAMWDNRSTWHKALNDYQGHRRLMHRVTVEGVPISA